MDSREMVLRLLCLAFGADVPEPIMQKALSGEIPMMELAKYKESDANDNRGV